MQHVKSWGYALISHEMSLLLELHCFWWPPGAIQDACPTDFLSKLFFFFFWSWSDILELHFYTLSFDNPMWFVFILLSGCYLRVLTCSIILLTWKYWNSYFFLLCCELKGFIFYLWSSFSLLSGLWKPDLYLLASNTFHHQLHWHPFLL